MVSLHADFTINPAPRQCNPQADDPQPHVWTMPDVSPKVTLPVVGGWNPDPEYEGSDWSESECQQSDSRAQPVISQPIGSCISHLVHLIMPVHLTCMHSSDLCSSNQTW